MNKNLVIKAIAFIVMLQSTATAFTQNSADSTAIINILHEETAAWNKGDAKAYSRHFAEDGTFTNILGMFSLGHKNFLETHDMIFKKVFLGTHLQQKVVSLKFAGPGVAVLETLSWVTGFKNGPSKGTYLDDEGRLRVRLLQVFTKQGSDWKIIAYHNVDIKPGVPAPELQ